MLPDRHVESLLSLVGSLLPQAVLLRCDLNWTESWLTQKWSTSYHFCKKKMCQMSLSVQIKMELLEVFIW